MVAPLIIAIRTAAIRTAPAMETTVRATTIVLAATGLSIPAIRAITTVPAEMAARIIVLETTTPVITVPATIIVRTMAIVPITALTIDPVITSRTGRTVRVIVPG